MSAATTAAVAAASAQALRASGAIVRVEPATFVALLTRAERPLVVVAETGFFSSSYQYLAPYRGLVFFTKSSTPLPLPGDSEVIRSKSIWIPG
jgi:hypothetical protein